ncbi:MAG: molybdopterin-dependent oxidoreductase, partial [Coriobacteriales bacterium]|nr:molybdopterin-dependent oxidoreductase [Coriobacteriales bacterium]
MEEQSKSKKTVYRDMGFNGFGSGENAVAVDVEDGRIVRIRPLHLDEKYEESYLNRWTIEARGHVLQSPLKTTAVPFGTVYKQRVYSRNRVPYPMKRVDWDPNGERHPENRGQSDYVRISWDEATDIIASEIRRCIETYGPTSIFCQGDGHGEGKVMGGGHGCNTHLMNLMGGFTLQARQPDSWEGWYWGAKYIWGMDPVGEQVPQDNLLKDILDNTDCTLMWGCDPETTPWGWGGQGPSMLSFFWTEIGIKQIYICPDVNYGCAVHADKWIPVLPNTDAALQLGIAYTWIKENLYDKEYVETHSVGFDWFERYVMGGEDGVPKTPKWAEGKCGVPARQIKALARYWAARNVTICHCNGGGYIRSAFSTEPARLEVDRKST